MISVGGLCEILSRGRFDLTDEKACQADIADWLAAERPGWSVEREVRLTRRDIVDFVVGGDIAVEVKMRGARSGAVVRQLARYARSEAVRALVVATNRAFSLPASIDGKPVYVVSLGSAWL